jgi:hypothetical protein
MSDRLLGQSITQSLNEPVRIFRCDKPGPILFPLDPDEFIRPRDIHLHKAPFPAPEPSKSSAQPTGSNAQTPPDFLS